MAKAAIISDIHSNLEALVAVLEDIERQGIDEIFCLGDIVGYGPDPVACVDLVRDRCKLTVRGNHDDALFKGAWGFRPSARDAVDWTRKKLQPRFLRPASRKRWDFLESLPLEERWNGYLFVHGSPRNPIDEYVMPDHARWPPPGMFEEIFSVVESVCFIGHTHYAGVFAEGPCFTPQAEITGPFQIDNRKMLINVGSVGQPRDRDPRSCYLTIDDGEFLYRRVTYPIEVTQAKIRSTGVLDEGLADRLERGE